jgi:fused signal recognition particle receptor
VLQTLTNNIDTLVIAAAGGAALLVALIVAILVRWSRRKRRTVLTGATATSATVLAGQEGEATLEPTHQSAPPLDLSPRPEQTHEQELQELQSQPESAGTQSQEVLGELSRPSADSAPTRGQISKPLSKQEASHPQARADSGEQRSPLPEASIPSPSSLPRTSTQVSKVELATRKEGKEKLPEPAEAPQETTARAQFEPRTHDGSRDELAESRSRVPFALKRTRERFIARLRAVFASGRQIEEICAGLEEALIEADVGVETSVKLIDAVRSRVKRGASAEDVQRALKDEIIRLLKNVPAPPPDPAQPPLVVMLVGVNGVGKTTTVAKLAAYFKAERGSVIVGAADTFRAAAVEQLEVWCRRVGVELIKHKAGGDPAAVAFDTVKAAVARRAAVALIDTAGRVQTKTNLMEELKKIARVIAREVAGAPHEVWLVLDATTGQNALSQAKLFSEAVHLTGVVLAKLDSSAKGGVVLGIVDRLGLAVRFVGVGEGLQDLRPFDGEEFVRGIFETEPADEQAAISAYSA